MIDDAYFFLGTVKRQCCFRPSRSPVLQPKCGRQYFLAKPRSGQYNAASTSSVTIAVSASATAIMHRETDARRACNIARLYVVTPVRASVQTVARKYDNVRPHTMIERNLPQSFCAFTVN